MVTDDYDASTSASAETSAPAPAEAETGTDASAGVSDPGAGECSPETLQDFVLNIINDPLAKAAYLADPAAALGAAGLGDLTEADVQEVLPLVADIVPADLSALPVVGDLSTDGLLGDLPAVGDLGGLTGAVPAVGDLGGLTGAVPAVGDLTGVAGGLPLVGDVAGVAGDLPLVGDLTGVAGDLPAVGDLGGLTGAVPAVGDLTGVAGGLPLVGDLTGVAGDLPAVGDLGGLTGAVPAVGDLGGLTGAVPAVGDLGGLTSAVPAVGDLGGLTGALPVELPELGALPTSGLPLVNDLPVGVPGLGDLSAVQLPQVPSLDTPLGDVTTAVDGVAGVVNADVATGGLLDSSASGYLNNPENDAAPTVSATVDSLLGDGAAGVKLAPEEFGGSANFTSDLVDVGGGLVGHAGGDTGVWGGANTPLGDVAVGGLVSPEDGLALAAKTPLADVRLDNTDLSIQPADTADLLDVDHLGNTGDAITGTVSGVVSTGSGVVSESVDGAGDTLGGYLTGSLGTVGDTLESTTDTVSGTVGHSGDMVSDQVTTLPAVTDSVPLGQLPALPELPDVPDVSSDDLSGATDLTSHLPATLPAVSLPDTSSLTEPVTNLVSNSAVGDVVHDGPVGGLVEGVTGHLPQVGDVAGLDLGL